MKKINIPFIGLILSFLAFTACEYDGIDPITAVNPGSDAGAPQITISYPTDGSTIKVKEPVTSITIKFQVEDDIEVGNIEVSVDGSQIASFSEFKDYRLVKKEVPFDEVTSGDHTLTITATDLSGNTTTETVNFSKEPPYTPRFANEYFYMPFNGDFTELVTVTDAVQVGTPGFTDDAYLGTKAYLGAPDSYLKFPFDGSIGDSFTVAFWYKIDPNSERAAILNAGNVSENTENRNQGFRFFREPDQTNSELQRFKLNIGIGSTEIWNDGGTLDPTTNEWVHIAFTVSPTETVIYFNGMPVGTKVNTASIDWTGVKDLIIGAGGETFSYWQFNVSDSSPMDELRIFDTALTQTEIQDLINASAETLYMPFDGDYKDLIENREVTVVGDPGFSSESISGIAAYAGTDGAYLTFPSAGLLSEEFSATFWYKVNSTPDRAGIISVSAVNENDPNLNNLNYGFRLFREGSADSQTIKASVGNGSANSWNLGGDIDATTGEWVHIAFTISNSESKIYFNGELVNTATVSGGVDWTGADIVSVMSGAPRFIEWNHFSDRSLMDELKFYNKELTQEEIQAAMAQ